MWPSIATVSTRWLDGGEFIKIEIDNKLKAFENEGLCLHHRLMRRAPRAEAVTVLAECWIPQRL